MAWVCSYELKCDGTRDDGSDCLRWSDAQLSREEAVEWAGKCGWLVLTRKHYCPRCRLPKEKNRKGTARVVGA